MICIHKYRFVMHSRCSPCFSPAKLTLSIRQNVINGNNYMMGYVYMTCKIKISMFLKVHNNITCG